MSISFWEFAVIGVVVVLVFGRGKISGLMSDVAQGIKAFKTGLKEDTLEDPIAPSAAAQSRAEPIESVL